MPPPPTRPSTADSGTRRTYDEAKSRSTPGAGPVGAPGGYHRHLRGSFLRLDGLPARRRHPRRRPGQAHAFRAAQGAAPARRTPAGRACARRGARAFTALDRRRRRPRRRRGRAQRLQRPTSSSCARIRRGAPAMRCASRSPRCPSDGVTLVGLGRRAARARRQRSPRVVEIAQRRPPGSADRAACADPAGLGRVVARSPTGTCAAIVEERDATAEQRARRRDQHRRSWRRRRALLARWVER